ncbi:hypothetical protein CWR48_15605 [Oceanobacillus arenosus]|uniref:Uncharacterized protein n=1 Tax=Oceanobacillus arenosus TaxID=1229153 RepID=A0A3D8PLM3_9BACI|nr:hypothetical protein [Oceanobacillus arenosus]RDW17026.1 hypothetical protein CWR48_15605 [Oceanobacillus arenosus]
MSERGYHLERTKHLFGKVADSQEDKGIAKYGKPLDPMDNYDWLQMALEEQVDGTKYLIAEMEKRRNIINEIRLLVADNCSSFAAFQEIKQLLDRLEGVNRDA